MNVEPITLIVATAVPPWMADSAPPQPEFAFYWHFGARHITWGAGARRVAHKRPCITMTPDGQQLLILDEYLSEARAR